MKGARTKEISIKRLILYCLFSLEKESDFDSLTEKCFKEFPAVFSMKRIKKWPDARKLDRPLRELREENFITFKKNKFSLTKKGEKEAEKIRIFFSQKLF